MVVMLIFVCRVVCHVKFLSLYTLYIVTLVTDYKGQDKKVKDPLKWRFFIRGGREPHDVHIVQRQDKFAEAVSVQLRLLFFSGQFVGCCHDD